MAAHGGKPLPLICIRNTQYDYFNAILGEPDWRGKKILDFGGNVGGFLIGSPPEIKHHDYWCIEPDNLLKRGEEIQIDVDETDAIDIVLKVGEMSLHHNSIIHGSRANKSDTKRIGFIARFVTPEYTLGSRRTPFLRAKGNADCGHLTLAEQPADLGIREAVTAWERSNAN